MKQVDNIPTPFYLIDQRELSKNLTELKSALTHYWPNYEIGYSYKTNALPWLLQYFQKHGCYAEVVSKEEYFLGKKIGVPKDRFIYNGPVKTKDTFVQTAMDGCIINIDSQRELHWLADLPTSRDYKIGLRVNFDIESECPGQSQCGKEGGRFGFCLENGDLSRAIQIMRDYNIEPRGLHLHVSSKTRSIEIYQALARKACQIIQEYDLHLSFLDVGGGFFGGMPQKPQFGDYIREISAILRPHISSERTTLIVEPGISLVGSPISYVTSVIDIKKTTYNQFVVIDGSRIDVDPLMHKSSYLYEILADTNRKDCHKQIICGCTCMENDRLLTIYDGIELKVTDKIVFKKVGGYTMCLTPLFIKYFPDVYVCDNDGLHLVRSAWGPEEYIQRSEI